jgi:hypothetical protein
MILVRPRAPRVVKLKRTATDSSGRSVALAAVLTVRR